MVVLYREDSGASCHTGNFTVTNFADFQPDLYCYNVGSTVARKSM